MAKALSIDGKRLYSSLAELGKIGAYKDERTGIIGVNRLALTAADGAGRRLVVKWFRQAGLHVTIDRIGNVYGRRRGLEDHLPPVMLGSHIDSVPTAGRFDGCLGVLGALEVVRTLNDAKAVTRRPLIVGFFTDEEGCRFGTDMLGSATATRRLPLDKAYALKDRDGLTVKGELEKIGFLGTEPVGKLKPHAYLECHIEQGPILRHKSLDCGVVMGVQAISWQELTIIGKSCHAGTTPMNQRADAACTVAEFMLTCEQRALRDGNSVATMGQLKRERIFDPDTRLTQPREIFFAATLLSVPSSERELAVMRGVLNPNLTFSSNARPTPALLSRAVNMVSTPKGILTGKEARKEKIGGEVICEVY